MAGERGPERKLLLKAQVPKLWPAGLSMAASGGSIGFDSSSSPGLDWELLGPLGLATLVMCLDPLPGRECEGLLLLLLLSCLGVSVVDERVTALVEENECSNGFGSRSNVDRGGGR